VQFWHFGRFGNIWQFNSVTFFKSFCQYNNLTLWADFLKIYADFDILALLTVWQF